MTDKTFIFVDIETTGLVVGTDRILEVAMIATGPGPDFVVVDTLHVLVDHGVNPKAMVTSPVVIDMHESSGLFADLYAQVVVPAGDDIEDGDMISASELAGTLDLWLADMHAPGDAVHLAGAAVHFDRAHLLHAYPGMARHISHRMLDVRALDLCFGAPMPSGAAHRALDDAEAARCRAIYYASGQHAAARIAGRTL